MLFALILLMIAIAVVAFRDRQFLFESEPAQSNPPAQAVQTSQVQPPDLSAAPSSQASESQAPSQKPSTVATAPAVDQPAPPKTVAATAPKPSTIPHSAAVSKAAAAPKKHVEPNPSAATVTAQAAQRAHMADVTVQEPSATLYPRLDQRTKVEGSVELQALVGADGTIRELHVLRGPAVLGSAAREAVLQWKFKPFTENGVAVETFARITVNFTIKVVDGSQKTIASVQPEHVIILADNYQR
jgi:TonB family protein